MEARFLFRRPRCLRCPSRRSASYQRPVTTDRAFPLKFPERAKNADFLRARYLSAKHKLGQRVAAPVPALATKALEYFTLDDAMTSAHVFNT